MQYNETEQLTISEAEIDLRIIQAIQQGNRNALAELYDRHNAWLLAVNYRILQNRRDAEDLLHDVFLEIWKKADSYKENRGTVTSWLAVKIRSRALDRIRAINRVKKHLMEDVASEIDSAPSMNETDPSYKVDFNLARQMLKQLNPAQRTIIELSYFRGFTCQEIANHCQMPLGTAKSGLLRSIQILRRKFNNKKVSPTCQ